MSARSVLSMKDMEHLSIRKTFIYRRICGRRVIIIVYKIKFGIKKVNKSQFVLLIQEPGISGFIKILWGLNICLYLKQNLICIFLSKKKVGWNTVKFSFFFFLFFILKIQLIWESRKSDKSFNLLSILLTLLKSCLLFLQCPEKSLSFFYVWFSVSVLPGLTYLLNSFSYVEWSSCFLCLVVCFLSLVLIHKRHCFSFTSSQHKFVLSIHSAFFILKPLNKS